MNIKFACLILATLILSSAATANPTVTTASTAANRVAAVSAAQTMEKSFSFNWNDFSSIAPNKNKITKIETYLQSINDFSGLPHADRVALGKLFYKLGTFYTHVTRKPDLAIARLNSADALLTDPQDKAWNDNHLAYAYELNYATSGLDLDKKRALQYIDKVITRYPGQKNKEVAFAYCVQGLVLNDAKKYQQAETSYKKALAIYAALPDGKDDQYARAKNRLANIILDQNGRDKEALTMLQALEKYWLAQGDLTTDPYAARNFITLGQAYLKMGQMSEAKREFTAAIAIYKKVYGANSEMLVKPYGLLAATEQQQTATQP